MGTLGIVVCLMLAGVAVAQAVLTGMQTWEHRRFARSRLRAPRSGPSGRAVLLVPCRGLEVGLEENLRAVLVQDRGDYEVWFIVESPDDPVYPVIEKVVDEYPGIDTRVIFAGRATRSGQKVHNLLVATAELPAEVRYLAFVDSDARPEPRWLGGLLQRLDDAGVGAATGYRWFVPQRASVANHLLYSLNCAVAMLFGKNAPNFVWGGSWAIRRETFERLGLREAWQGTLSDDLVASRVLHRAGLRIEFEPACVVASPLDSTFGEMVSFVRRQYVIGRFYVPHCWAIGFLLVTFANLVFFGALGATIGGLVMGTPPPWLPAMICGVLYLAGVYRGLLRQDILQVYFPRLNRKLKRARRFDVWAGPLVGLLNGLQLAGALLGRHISWRGITYRLSRGGQVRLVRWEDQADRPRPQRWKAGPASDGPVLPLPSHRKAA